MNHTSIPSLEYQTLVRTTISVWSKEDIRRLVTNFHHHSCSRDERREEWQAIENRVLENVTKLAVPNRLRSNVLDIVKPIGIEILKWKDYHEKFFLGSSSLQEVLSKLSWTSLGTIDLKKTAEFLVEGEIIDVTQKYRLACTYCLEDYIYALWEHLSAENFWGKNLEKICCHEEPLIVFWSHYMNEETVRILRTRNFPMADLLSPYEHAFINGAATDNKEALCYFFKKLTPEEKERVLLPTAKYVAFSCCTSHDFTGFPRIHFTDKLYFLLSQMNEEQQMTVLNSCPSNILRCFLDWPWQDFYTSRKALWRTSFMHEQHYFYLLSELKTKMLEGYRDYDYQRLFGMLWKQCLFSFKQPIVELCLSTTLLLDLFKIEDVDDIKLILNEATVTHKEDLILSSKGKEICGHLVLNDKWDLLKFFIQECVSSKHMMIKFKKELKTWRKAGLAQECFVRKRKKWVQFCKILRNINLE